MFRPLFFASASAFLAFAIQAGGQKPAASEITFNKHISPILSQKCIGCHYEGGPAPFKLTSYRDAKKHGDLIELMAILQKMPPTEGESDCGAPAIYPKLTNGEVQLISRWLEGGMVEGDGNPADLTPPKVGWELGEPDVVLETPAIQVPAQGGTWKTVVRFPVDEKLAGEVNAFDIRAEDPWVDRQAILAVEKPKEPDTFRATGLEISRVIGFWGLGYRPWKLPADAGIHVEKGSVLAVQMLYHPSGTAEDGRFKIGLYFAKKPVSRRPYWATLGTDSFTITGEPRWTTLEASYTLPDTATLICIQPEARALATQVWLSSNSDPGLGERDLMHIYRWDPRWAGAYNLENPPTLGRNTILKTSIEYDNSNHTDTGLSLSEVKLAPPRAPVHFGPREADELFWVHVQLLPVK